MKNGPLNYLSIYYKYQLDSWQKTRYRKHPQISWNLNLAIQILQKNFFQRNEKKYKVKSLALFQMCMHELLVKFKYYLGSIIVLLHDDFA